MRVLVTGASGFIGRRLVARLLADQHDVLCLVRRTSARADIAPGARFVVGDILDVSSLDAALAEGPDVVCHLASLLKMPWDPAFQTVNVQGTANLAAACARQPRPPRLVVVSSLAARGPAGGDAPVSIYGRVKRAAEEAALAQSAALSIAVVRPPMVYGPEDRSVLKLFRTAARGWHVVPGWQDRRVSAIHVDDLAVALALVCARGAGLYYSAGPEQVTYAELGRRIGAALGPRPVRVVRVPEWLAHGVAAVSELWARLRSAPTVLNRDKAREGVAGDWTCEPGRLEAELGFACAHTLESGLQDTAAGYRRAGWLG